MTAAGLVEIGLLGLGMLSAPHYLMALVAEAALIRPGPIQDGTCCIDRGFQRGRSPPAPPRFFGGGAANGITDDLAERIFEQVEVFSGTVFRTRRVERSARK